MDEEKDTLINSFISAGAEVPGVLFVALTLRWIGRRNLQTLTLAVCGVCLFLLLIPDLPRWLALGLSFIARAAILAAYAVAYLYTPELYSTVLRASGLGSAAAMAKLASVGTPFVAKLPAGSEHITLAVFASMCVVTSASTLLLPQDRGTTPQLHDFVETSKERRRGEDAEKQALLS